VTGFTETVSRQPGTYTYQWPTSAKKRRAQDEPLGRWRWVVSATDSDSQTSSVERSFWLNDTLGFMTVAPRSVRLRPKTRTAVVARFKLAAPARVTSSIWTPGGILIRRLPGRNLAAGTRSIAWNGRFQNGRLVYRGTYVFKVFAQNGFGPVDLSQNFVIRR
jgi:flagellar hook assembly protein FlgD